VRGVPLFLLPNREKVAFAFAKVGRGCFANVAQEALIAPNPESSLSRSAPPTTLSLDGRGK
jgi:hypothetical protein